jgi:cysteinyl-tRNA synthetase
MGGQRFDALEAMLPEPRPVLGLDEHTACILDMATSRAEVRGIGAITLRTPEGSMSYQSGEQFDLAVLREGRVEPERAAAALLETKTPPPGDAGQAFWQKVHELEARFQQSLARDDPRGASNALLAFDRLIWQAQEGAENESVVVQARDTLRDMIVTLGNQLDAAPGLQVDDLAPLVEALLALREKFRRERQWEAADGLRAALDSVNIQVEDAPEGARWHFSPAKRRRDAARGAP